MTEENTDNTIAHKDDLASLTDFQLLQQARAERAYLALAIKEGMDIDPSLLASIDKNIERFEQDVEAARIALEKLAESTDKLNRSADKLLALLPENARISFYVPPNATTGKKDS